MNKSITFVGFAFSYTLSIIMFITFLVAFFNHSKSVLITINKYGEANIELISMSLIMILITITFFGFCREVIHGKK